MTRSCLVAAVLALAVPAGAYTLGPVAASKGPRGEARIKLDAKLWNRFNVDLRKEDDVEDLHDTQVEFQARMRMLPNANWQFVAGEQYRYGELKPYEIYANWSLDHLNLKVGNFIERWGKSDERSPLDILNPEDFREGVARSRGERKIPVPMASLKLSSNKAGIQGVYIPFLYPTRFDFFGSDWAVFGQFQKQAHGPFPAGLVPAVREEEPVKTARNATVAGKLFFSLGPLDLGFSAISGFDPVPTQQPLTSPAPPVPSPGTVPTPQDAALWALATGQTLRFTHERMTVYGFEFETVLGSLGLRGDAVYVTSRTFTTVDSRRVGLPVMQGMVGVDYTGANDTYFNFYVSQTRMQDFDPKILYAYATVTEFSGELSQALFRQNISLAYRFFFDPGHDTFFHNPRVVFQYIQNFSLEFGVDVIDAPRGSFLGNYRGNDRGYALLRGFF